jgi:hypothetical protein
MDFYGELPIQMVLAKIKAARLAKIKAAQEGLNTNWRITVPCPSRGRDCLLAGLHRNDTSVGAMFGITMLPNWSKFAKTKNKH